ncbi:MAG: hypothetical protein JRJ35_15200 [Deltaproteobacteria bacterium]|nr:hypothetical protein [Deltaproteobacteria bacterium]
MVMDNSEAVVRHGVRPTYKGVKGFQPLQMTWRGFVIDAVFRRGDAHCNHGDTVEKMPRHVVRKIRKHYRGDVPIMAAKIVSHGRKVILKITQTACHQLDFFLLRAGSGAPPNYCRA